MREEKSTVQLQSKTKSFFPMASMAQLPYEIDSSSPFFSFLPLGHLSFPFLKGWVCQIVHIVFLLFGWSAIGDGGVLCLCFCFSVGLFSMALRWLSILPSLSSRSSITFVSLLGTSSVFPSSFKVSATMVPESRVIGLYLLVVCLSLNFLSNTQSLAKWLIIFKMRTPC